MAGEAMVNGGKSAYNGRISLDGSQKVNAPAPVKGAKKTGSVKTGKDLRVGK
jgi:hypothetical protein